MNLITSSSAGGKSIRLRLACSSLSAVFLLAACAEPYDRRAAMDARFADLMRETGSPLPGGPLPLGQGPGAAAEPPPRPTYVERGGLRIRMPDTATTPDIAPGDGVELNFPQADIKEFARTVLGNILGLTYAIDPRIEGTISLETGGPVPRDQVLPVLERVLQMHGAALAPMPGGYQIVPADIATQNAAISSGPGVGVRIIALQHVDAAQAAALVQPIVPPGAVVSAIEDQNLLLVAGSRSQIDLIEATVLGVDIDRLRGKSFALRPLRYAAPTALAEEMTAIFGTEDGAGDIRFYPMERLNAVVVVTSAPETVDRMLGWIDRFDQEGGGAVPETFVYPVQNGRAADLAQTLGQLLGAAEPRSGIGGEVAPGLRGRQVAAAGDSFLRPSVVEDEITGGLAGQGADDPLEGEVPLIEDEGGGAVAGPQLVVNEPDLKIIADEKRNALVINATRREYQRIENTLRQLDVQPLQVLIEATIAEVTLTDQLRYGLQWFFRSGNFQAILSQVGGGVVNPTFPGFNTVFDGADVRVVLSALSAITDVRVISSPQVMVLTNETALLQVGDSVPVPVQQAIALEEADSVLVNSIEYRDTGVTLQVRPRVNDSGIVTLEIEQDVSDAVVTTSSGIDAPTIQRRRIASTVAVGNGETLGLGGLIRDSAAVSNDGVPILSELPVVGPLFGTRGVSIGRTELLVLLTPRVVRGPIDARGITQEMRSRMSGMQPLRIPVIR